MTQATLQVRTPEGEERRIHAETGRNLMQILRDHNFPIAAVCGGCLSCATCHIYVDADWWGRLPSPTEAETDILNCDPAYEETASRLACQIEVTADLEGLALTLAPET